MDWKERITVDPKILVGKPIIRGTRISVELILDALGAGATIDDLLEDYPHLKREDIFACIKYGADSVRNEVVRVATHPADSGQGFRKFAFQPGPPPAKGRCAVAPECD